MIKAGLGQNNTISQNLFNKKREENFFLTENLFSKKVLSLKSFRNNHHLYMQKTTSNLLPKIRHKYSKSIESHKSNVFNHLINLKNKLDEVEISNVKKNFIDKNQPTIGLNYTHSKIKNDHKNTGFFKSFNEQLKKRKIYIIENDKGLTFANSSIEKAINERKSIVEELKDLRDNSYDINNFVQSRQQSNTNKINSNRSNEVQTSTYRSNTSSAITSMLRIKHLDDKNDKKLEKISYNYRNKVFNLLNKVTELISHTMNPNSIPRLIDVYKDIKLSQVLTIDKRVVQRFKFK